MAWLLAGALLLCAIFISIIHLYVQFNRLVAEHRIAISETAYTAKAVLNLREEFLKHVAGPVLIGPPRRDATMQGGEPVYRELKPGFFLALSPADLRQARRLHVNLLFMLGREQLTVRRLESGFPAETPVPERVQRQLRERTECMEACEPAWLSDRRDPLRRMYMALPVLRTAELDKGEQAWLALEFQPAELLASQAASGYEFTLSDAATGMEISAPAARDQAPGWQGWLGAILPGGGVQALFALEPGWTLSYRYPAAALLGEMRGAALNSLLLLGCTFLLLALCGLCLLRRFVLPAQRRLRQQADSEAFLRSVFDAAPVALCALRRRDGQMVLENQLARDWLPAAKPNWKSAEWVERVYPRARPLPAGGVGEELLTVDGRHLFASLVPSRYRGEEVLLCALSDISLRKQAEQELERAKQLADAANEAKTAFLAIMSHEIRTPLYGVFGNLELLKHSALDPQQQGYVQAIQNSSATLLGLINDVLDVSRIEAGQLRLEAEPFSLFDLVHETVHGYAASALSKGLWIYACVDPRFCLPVRGDPHKVRQILNNLLSNAVKFTDSGRIVVRCSVFNGENDAGWAAIQVADTGVGIAAADQASLFQPFFQAGEGRGKAGGAGLGLPICLQLAVLMGGDIDVVSEPGLGSSFTLRLPLSPEAGAVAPLLARRLIHVGAPVRELADSLSDWLNALGAQAAVCAAEELPRDGCCVEVCLDGGPRRRANWPGARVWRGGEAARAAAVWVSLYEPAAILHAIVAELDGLTARAPPAWDAAMPGRLELRVLAVEDNEVNRQTLRQQLEMLGCRVRLAADGMDALQQWNARDFDVVLTDINMPRMDGLRLTRAIHEREPGFPVVGTTASNLPQDHNQARAAGMAAVIVKPVDLAGLFQCLGALERSTTRGDLSQPAN